MTHLHLAPSIVACITLGSLTIVGFRLTPAPQNPAGNNPPTYSGTVGEWWVAVSARVQFQLIGSGRDTKDGKHADLWFDTPADKDINTLFEDLVLDVVMHAASKGVPIVVEAKNSSGDDGSVPAKAFDVVRVGLGKQ